jgi:hypothetical protein
MAAEKWDACMVVALVQGLRWLVEMIYSRVPTRRVKERDRSKACHRAAAEVGW